MPAIVIFPVLGSSAAAHVRPDADPHDGPVLDLRAWQSQFDARRWAEVLKTSIDEEALAERIRQATLRGRPLGSKSFVHFLEESSGRRMQPRPPGRPRLVPRPRRTVPLWGSLASCVPVGNRHTRRLPIAAQDTILPHRIRTLPHGHSTRSTKKCNGAFGPVRTGADDAGNRHLN